MTSPNDRPNNKPSPTVRHTDPPSLHGLSVIFGMLTAFIILHFRPEEICASLICIFILLILCGMEAEQEENQQPLRPRISTSPVGGKDCLHENTTDVFGRKNVDEKFNGGDKKMVKIENAGVCAYESGYSHGYYLRRREEGLDEEDIKWMEHHGDYGDFE